MSRYTTGLNTPEMQAIKAVQTNNIKFFLTEYFTFRAWITFKDSGKRRIFYGNEHDVTLNQLLCGHREKIVLDKVKGLTDLITLIEKTWKGKWKSAIIFMREEHGGPFNTEVRRYYNGSIEDEQSPVLERETEVLYFVKMNGYYPIFTTEPPELLPDFAKEISENLKPTEI